MISQISHLQKMVYYIFHLRGVLLFKYTSLTHKADKENSNCIYNSIMHCITSHTSCIITTLLLPFKVDNTLETTYMYKHTCISI